MLDSPMVDARPHPRLHRARLLLGVPPASDSLQMVRWIFLAFTVASAAGILVLLLVAAPLGRPLDALVALLLPFLCLAWVDEYRGAVHGLVWDAVELAALLAVGVGSANPLAILLLLYVRVAGRSLSDGGRAVVPYTAGAVCAVLGSLAVVDLGRASSGAVVDCLFLSSGFLIVTPVMRMLGATLGRLARATTREVELRRALDALAPALDADVLAQAAVDAVRALVKDPASHVALALRGGDGLRIAAISSAAPGAAAAVGRPLDLDTLPPASRDRLRGGEAVHLVGPELAAIWPAAGGPAPQALFLAPVLAADGARGLMVIAGPAVPADERVAITTLAAHVAVRLTAATLSDELHRRRTEDQVREKERNFQQLFDVNPLPMWLYDASTREFIAVNDSAIRQYGWTRDGFLAMRVDDLAAASVPPAPHRRERRRADATAATQHRLQDGRVIDVEVDTSRLRFESRDAVLMLARDVTAERELHRRLEHQTLHDALTGLPNRRLLDAELARAIDRVGASGHRPALIALDLDGFKTINDTLGHAFGDRVISAVAKRLAFSIRPGDTAARLAGDEFAVLLDDTGGPDDALQVAHRLVAEIERPLDFGEQTLSISASIGVAMVSAGATPDEALGDADVAMYVAKARGTGCCAMFEPAHRAALIDRLSLQAELGEALHRGQLSVVYQPQVDIVSGRAVAAEALVRWHHPARGMVPPDVFIPIAEQMGLVPAIDAWVLGTACHQLRAWLDEGLTGMRVAVNLSGADLERPDIVDIVRHSLEEAMLDPWRLELELTESVAVTQTEAAVARLAELRAMGVRIAIDDFGTGYSMFSRLRALPVDRLKIDRSFVTDLTVDDDARAIVASTITMGHALGLDLVAEGVETAEAYATLRELGCDTAQGYHLSRPLPAGDVSRWVHERALVVPALAAAATG